jgi:CRP-like cAMP-binding protein
MLKSLDLMQTENQLLAALPPSEYQGLLPHLDPIILHLKEVLFTADETVPYVYFPNTGMVSLLTVMMDGHTVEVGVVGNEGAVGLSALMGGMPALNQGVVQASGSAMRIKASVIREKFKQGGMLQDLLLRFSQLLYAQASQTAACNGLHTVESRLARWLLVLRDRSLSDKLELTQELLAQMLGVRRSSVSLAASGLQRAEIIDYSRGKIKILDWPRLEAASCECYPAIKKLYDRFAVQELYQVAAQ